MLIFSSCQAYKDRAKQLVCDRVDLHYYHDTDDSYRTHQNRHCNLSLSRTVVTSVK